MILFQN